MQSIHAERLTCPAAHGQAEPRPPLARPRTPQRFSIDLLLAQALSRAPRNLCGRVGPETGKKGTLRRVRDAVHDDGIDLWGARVGPARQPGIGWESEKGKGTQGIVR